MVTFSTWCKRMRSRITLCIILIYDLFSNGWIEDDNGKIYIYYASSDTRLHVAESTVSQLVDYCLHTPTDGFRSIESVKRIITMVNHNKQYLKQ